MGTVEHILVVEELTKGYGDVTVLDRIGLRIGAGEVHGLLGPNGAGKSTALHAMTGLLPASSGSVLVDGTPVGRARSRLRLGFAPDDLPLPAHLTGAEYLRFHDRARGQDCGRQAGVLAAALELDRDLDRLVVEYSHGMKRKLQVIAAVMHRPALLVLDEPYRGLDPDAVVTVRQIISSVAESGGAVLVATHDLFRAEREFDAVTVLDHGVVVAQGAPRRLREEQGAEDLEGVFLKVTGLEGLQAQRNESIREAFGVREPVGAGAGATAAPGQEGDGR